MVDVLGHLGMGLLWAVPAWFLWQWRVSLTFVGFVLLTSMLPDIDLYLPGIRHHGVTHTILFVAIVAFIGGVLLTVVVTPVLKRWWRRENDPIAGKSILVFAVGGLLLGGLSHLFTDMLSTSSVERTIEPFWPFFDKPVSIYLIHDYSQFVWNGGLLVVAVLTHLVLLTLNVAPIRNADRDR